MFSIPTILLVSGVGMLCHKLHSYSLYEKSIVQRHKVAIPAPRVDKAQVNQMEANDVEVTF